MNILIVAPTSYNINTLPELASVATGNTPTILSGTVTRDQLDQSLASRQYDVLHFILHGDYGILALSDGMITAEALARSCRPQCSLRLIIVNSCNSLGTAVQLHNALHVPVIAHEQPISDQAGIAFARELYKSLAAGAGIVQAFQEARDTVLRLYPADAENPQIIDGDMATNDAFREVLERLGNLEAQMKMLGEKVDEHSRGGWQSWVLGLALFVVLVINTYIQLVK